jgi:mannose-1-phosphate guanylyltransferase
MKAVVLVGGFGTRLRPLTLTTPKPMLPIGRVPMVERIVERLVAGGVDEVVLALGFGSDAFQAAYPDGRCAGARLTYATEPEPLDTAGAVAFAARYVGIDDTFIVVNGDILTDLDVAAMVAAHRASGARGTIHLTEVEDPSAFGVADLDGTRIARFVEKPAKGEAPSNLINAGTYVLEASVLDLVPVGARVSIEREIFPVLAAEGSLVGHSTDDYWLDTGRPEQYLQANTDLVAGRPGVTSPSCAPADAHVADSAVVTASVIGHGCHIGGEASVTRSVLLDDVMVGHGASVTGSILGRGAKVGAGASLQGVVLGDDAVVADGEHLVDTKRPA